jgi:hypothetical protein
MARGSSAGLDQQRIKAAQLSALLFFGSTVANTARMLLNAPFFMCL